MTWVYRGSEGTLFPRTKGDIRKSLQEVYPIRGREYDIKNTAESSGVVMVEMVESYPDPKSKRVYRTPLVIVLELVGGRIRKGRHYCDPNLSSLYLTKKQVEKAYE